MANETGRQTLNEVSFIEVDADPAQTGMPANVDVGDVIFQSFQRGMWQRVGSGSNDLVRLDAFNGLADVQATANSTKTLFSYSRPVQIFTGSTAGQVVDLPNATTVLVGFEFRIWNLSTQPITVRNNSGTVIARISSQANFYAILTDNTTSAGIWSNDAGNRVFGKNYASVESTGDLTNSSATTYVTRASLSIVNADPNYAYALTWNSKWKAGNANRGVQFQLFLDSTTELFNTIYFSANVSDYPYQGGTYTLSGLAAGNHTVELRFRVGIGATTITTSEARMRLWRVT